MLSDDSSSEEEQPKKNVKTVAKGGKTTTPPAKATKKVDSDDESESSDVDLLKKKTNRAAEVKKAETNGKAAAKKPVKPSESSDDESDESEVKVAKKQPVKAVPTKAAAKKQESSDDESSEEVKAPAKKTAVAATKAPVKAPAKKQESSDDEDSDEESDEKPKAKKAAVKAPAKKEESSDEESEEEPVKVTQKPQNGKTQSHNDSGSTCTELFLKNLSWKTDENMLWEFFGKYGEVSSVKVLTDRETGKPRGLAFVAFSTRDEAQSALDDADNLNIDGRLLQASFSDNKPQRDGNAGGNRGGFQQGGNRGGFQQGGGRGGFQGGDKHTIFVGNLGFKTTENSLKKFFADCGNVLDVRIAKNEEGRSKGFCHVDFDSADAVETAKSKAGQELDGRELRVDASTPRQGGGNRGGFGGGRGGFGGGRGGRGGRGGFGGNFNSMDRAKKSGAMLQPNPNSVVTFDDDD